jgi:hypothetical protein
VAQTIRDIDALLMKRAGEALLKDKPFEDVKWEFRRVIVIRDCHTYWYMHSKADPSIDLRLDKGLPY